MSLSALRQELLALDVAPFESRCLAQKACGTMLSDLGCRFS